jgi:hypothetical protein
MRELAHGPESPLNYSLATKKNQRGSTCPTQVKR